jgi:Tol biopolymer transport system component
LDVFGNVILAPTLDIDSDGDGLTDNDEINIFRTNPLDSDTDDDTILDGVDNCPGISNPGQENVCDFSSVVNGRIAFDSSVGDSEIYTMNSDGFFVTQLTDNSWSDFQPDWLSDGTKIAFVSTKSGDTEIYTMNSDGSSQTRITDNTVGDIQPVWSPDGTKIAISRAPASLYVIDSDGTGDTLIAAEGRNPSWSPDGSRITYSHFTNDGGDRDIFIVNSDGTNPTRITNTPEFEDFPDWSPDGLEIAYTSFKDGNGNIYKMNQDGNSPIGLTTDLALDQKPSWSPNGEKIVFQSFRDSTPEIYSMNSDGTGLSRLTNDFAIDDNPDWGIAQNVEDMDGDGIQDEIDTEPNVPSGEASDGTTSGEITSGQETARVTKNGNGLKYHSDGSPVEVSACDNAAKIRYTNGITTICGSITIEVIVGTAEVDYLVDDAIIASTSLVVGDNVTYDEQSLSITNHGENPVTIEVNGVETTIEEGGVFMVNEPPTAVANGPYLSAINTAASLNPEGSSDPDGDDLIFQWSTTSDCQIDNSEPSITCDETGIFDVSLTVIDPFGESGTDTTSVVVYDPEAGFVTGGGWIDSPAGAYVADPTLEGKATFGFVSKYNKGSWTPSGQTEFQFKVADLNFHSDTYEWLLVANAKAMYKGTGTINGGGNYGFLLFALDENLTPSTDVDLFRIQIWDKEDNSDGIVYDNEIGVDEDADPTTEIGGGSIVIHTGK